MQIFCVFAFYAATAQTEVNMIGGINLSSGTSTFSAPYFGGRTVAHFAPRVGLTLEQDLRDRWGLYTGLLYSGKGFKLNFEQLKDGVGEGEAKFALNYLELPIMAYCKINKFQAQLGTYAAFAINGRSTTVFEYLESGISQKLVNEQSLIFSDIAATEDDLLIPFGFRRSDFGLMAGLAYQLSDTGKLSFLFSKGLTNVISNGLNSANPVLNNAAFSVSLSFAINRINHL